MNTLIIGGSGSLGIEITNYFLGHKLLITYNNHYVENGIKYNAITMDLEKTISDLGRFDHAILLLADKDPNSCYKNKKYSNQLNVESIKRILNHLKKYKIKPIFLSTDVVFSGKKGNYIETDKPDPILFYGKQKVIIENFIISNFEDYLIFRLSKTFTLRKNTSPEPFYNWINFFEEKNKIYCATDQIYNPIYVNDAAEIIYQISRKNLKGIFNLAGIESFSRFEIFSKLYKEYYKYTKKEVSLINCKFNDLNLNNEKWPLNTSMIINKTLDSIELNFLTVENAIIETVKNYFK